MIFFKKFDQHNLNLDDIETIEGETRLYKTPVGNFPSMTSILSILNDGGLQGWIDHVGEEEANKIVKAASNRGNELHRLSELYLQNLLTKDDLCSKVTYMFNRNKKYLDSVTKVYAIEAALYSKVFKYAGRVDAVVEYDYNGKIITAILDHKNSRNAIDMSKQYARRKLFCYILQCTGYSIALEEMTGLKTTHGILIVGNYNQLNSTRFVFDLSDYKTEFYKLLAIYKNKLPKEESLFWKM